MNHGRSLELFFVDGTPDGILTAEMFNWTGHVLSAPRTRIADALARAEARHTGVYLLIGEQEDAPRAYIGEGEDVSRRIKDHDTGKDWWERCVIITTGRQELHKAHVRYLEARLISMVVAAGGSELDNGTRPAAQGLSEAAVASMEQFLEMLAIVLPAIGVRLLETGAVKSAPQNDPTTQTASPEFQLRAPIAGVDARGELRHAKFLMLKGSRIRSEWAGGASHNSGYRKLRDNLVAQGIIDASVDPAILVEDYEFNSPSAAAAIATGRAANGRTEWKLSDGTTFADWEDAQVRARIGDSI